MGRIIDLLQQIVDRQPDRIPVIERILKKMLNGESR